jgi:hypothetical protein
MRPREQSYDINTYSKYKIINSTKIEKDDKKKKENYHKLIDYVNSNITKKELTTNSPSHIINFHPPKYEGIKRSYVTKEKPVKFHEKATISCVEAGDINACQKPVNFQTFMAMFDSKEEIQEVDTEKLLCIDLEKLGSLKEKTSKIIEFVNYNDDINENDKNKALESFNDKIEEIKNTEDDINNIISNLSSIDKIVYGPEETKVIFKK